VLHLLIRRRHEKESTLLKEKRASGYLGKRPCRGLLSLYQLEEKGGKKSPVEGGKKTKGKGEGGMLRAEEMGLPFLAKKGKEGRQLQCGEGKKAVIMQKSNGTLSIWGGSL